MDESHGMHVLRLTGAERSELQALLKRELDEIRVEQRHTDDREFKRNVRAERELLTSLLAKTQDAH